MPNVWKHFASPIAKLYQFPEAEEVRPPEDPPLPEETPEDPLLMENEIEEADNQTEPVEEESPLVMEVPENPVSFAQHQADSILRDARQEAEEILEKARAEAMQQAEEIRAQAQKEGFDQGYAEGTTRGMECAMQECLSNQEEKLLALADEVKHFLEDASQKVDTLLDQYVEELRDLAITVAEKVVCVSLKSSDKVIGRMIQAAIDKRKRREWVQIYIAESDVKRLTPIPPSLTAALDMLSDRVRIIPIADEEPGTCIVEMPDEIIDASASTQIKNIRTVVSKSALSRAEPKEH